MRQAITKCTSCYSEDTDAKEDAVFKGRMNRAMQTLEAALHKSDIVPRSLGPDLSNAVVNATVISPLFLPTSPKSKNDTARKEAAEAVVVSNGSLLIESGDKNVTKTANQAAKAKRKGKYQLSKTSVILSIIVFLVVVFGDIILLLCLKKRKKAVEEDTVNKIDLGVADGDNPYVSNDRLTIDLHAPRTRVMSSQLNVDGVTDDGETHTAPSGLAGSTWQ